MNEIVGKLIGRTRAVTIFLFILCGALSSILCWGFVLSIQQGLGAKEAIMALPSQLQIAWGTVLGLIVGGHEEEINKMEKFLGVDIDKDGDIGVENAPATTQVTQPVQAAQVSVADPVQVAQVVQGSPDVETATRSNNSPG